MFSTSIFYPKQFLTQKILFFKIFLFTKLIMNDCELWKKSSHCEFVNLYEEKEKTSEYKGVHWDTRFGAWKTQLHLPNKRQKFGGYFKNEYDAAKRVNQLCEEFGYAVKNPIREIPNHVI
jgi:hypothetical protein